MNLKRKINKISFDTIAKELKKLDQSLKIGSITINNICNTTEFWSAFLVFFQEYLKKLKN